jgi:uncharacterized protein YkwD
MVGHYGSDGSSPFQRIDRYGEAAGYQAENISYGPNTGTEIIMGLFIDDGVPDRGHRTNMLNSNFGQTGIAFCRHTSKFNFMTEITYTGRFTPNEKAEERIRRLARERRGGVRMVPSSELPD